MVLNLARVLVAYDIPSGTSGLLYFSRSALCFQGEHGSPETMSRRSLNKGMIGQGSTNLVDLLGRRPPLMWVQDKQPITGIDPWPIGPVIHLMEIQPMKEK